MQGITWYLINKEPIIGDRESIGIRRAERNAEYTTRLGKMSCANATARAGSARTNEPGPGEGPASGPMPAAVGGESPVDGCQCPSECPPGSPEYCAPSSGRALSSGFTRMPCRNANRMKLARSATAPNPRICENVISFSSRSNQSQPALVNDDNESLKKFLQEHN